MTSGLSRAAHPRSVGVAGGEAPGDGHTGLRASLLGFVIMTGLVAVAATGVFILLDPRAQAFWATTLGSLSGQLAEAARGLVGR